MTKHQHPDPSSFFLQGGSVGVLLLHGFTGSPPEMRPIGEYLHERSLTVSAPLLPGHGTTAKEMNRCRWTDWTTRVEEALADLEAHCETAFVGGLSMGSLLTLYAAAHHPRLPGAILYSPATIIANRLIYLTPIFKHLIRKIRKSGQSDLTDPQAHLQLWHYDYYPVAAAHELLKLTRRVHRLLPQVTCPLLMVHTTLDKDIHPNSARYTYERVGSAVREMVTLHNSGHCLTVDSEWKLVAQKTYQFIADHLPEGAEAHN
ncbi:MAG: alpha/beta fold hydrolase [Anaerolineae bacterium]|jgi:carboxylesterase